MFDDCKTNCYNRLAELNNAIGGIDAEILKVRGNMNIASDTAFVQECEAKINELKASKTKTKKAAVNAVEVELAELAKKASEADRLKGEELTEDIKLLSSGISITGEELAKMYYNAETNENNTMMQMINRYAKDNGIKRNWQYVSNTERANNMAADVRTITSKVVKYCDTYPDISKRIVSTVIGDEN